MPCCFFYLENRCIDQTPSFPSDEYCPCVLPRERGWRRGELKPNVCGERRRFWRVPADKKRKGGTAHGAHSLAVLHRAQVRGRDQVSTHGLWPGQLGWEVATNSFSWWQKVTHSPGRDGTPLFLIFSSLGLLNFLKQYVIIIHARFILALEVTLRISVLMLTVWTQMCHTEHWKVKLWPESGGINILYTKELSIYKFYWGRLCGNIMTQLTPRPWVLVSTVLLSCLGFQRQRDQYHQ